MFCLTCGSTNLSSPLICPICGQDAKIVGGVIVRDRSSDEIDEPVDGDEAQRIWDESFSAEDAASNPSTGANPAPAAIPRRPSTDRPRQEYREIELPLDLTVDDTRWIAPGILQLDPTTEANINRYLLDVVDELAVDGWIPDHPITFPDLCELGLVTFTEARGHSLWRARSVFVLQSMQLRVRRWKR